MAYAWFSRVWGQTCGAALALACFYMSPTPKISKFAVQAMGKRQSKLSQEQLRELTQITHCKQNRTEILCYIKVNN